MLYLTAFKIAADFQNELNRIEPLYFMLKKNTYSISGSQNIFLINVDDKKK